MEGCLQYRGEFPTVATFAGSLLSVCFYRWVVGEGLPSNFENHTNEKVASLFWQAGVGLLSVWSKTNTSIRD